MKHIVCLRLIFVFTLHLLNWQFNICKTEGNSIGSESSNWNAYASEENSDYFLHIFAKSNSSPTYKPNWKSLDSRPLPKWFDEAKIGIFIHWGIWSVPGFGLMVGPHHESSYLWWLWKGGQKDVVEFMERNYKPKMTYPDIAAEFKPSFYDPEKWIKLFKSAGAKYVVLVAKFCDGFPMWPSATSFVWNSMATGPKMDIVGMLEKEVRKAGDLYFGVYHGMFEWYDPWYRTDISNEFKTNYFVERKITPQLMELVNNYKPDLIWSDAEGSASSAYWNSTNFLAWLYNESPVKDTVVVNDRWGKGTRCKHGGYFTCRDRYNPRKLQKIKFENIFPLDVQSWGFRNQLTIDIIFTTKQILTTLVETISCGGNVLIGIGPTASGTFPAIFEERLRDLGAWLNVTGEAIYGSKPWSYQNDTVTENAWLEITPI